MRHLRKVFDLWKGILAALVAIVLFLTNGLSILKIYQDENRRFWKIVLACGVALTLITCLYVFVKKSSAGAGFRSERKFLFPKRIRYTALAIALVTVATVLGGLWLGMSRRSIPAANKTIILVSNFDSLDGQNYGVTEKIIEQLRSQTSDYPDVSIDALNSSVTAQDGSAKARQIAAAHNAAICLWGWYRKTADTALVTVHFEVMSKPEELRLRKDQQQLMLPAKEMDSFQIQTRLSNEMTYLVLLTVGLARLQTEKYQEAIALFTRAISLGTAPDEMVDPANIYYFRGNSFLNTFAYRQAIADFTESLKITPENFCTACAFNNRAMAHVSLSEIDAALADLVEARKRNPSAPQIYCNLGFIYEKKGDIDNAIQSYADAIKQDPNFTNAYNNRADLYLKQNQFEKAIADCNEVLRAQPDNWKVLHNRGVALARLGRYGQAIDDLNAAEAMRPDKDQSEDSRHPIDKQHFLSEMAKDEAEIKSDPNAAAARVRRAILYNFMGDSDAAIGDLNAALRQEPSNAEAYHQRGKAFERSGQKDKALADFLKFSDLCTTKSECDDARQHLARLGVTR